MSTEAIPIVDGLFTAGTEPALIGGRRTNGSYVFPCDLGGGDPDDDGEEVEKVLLSRFGTLWSWTDSRYCPPAPFIPLTDPFEPVVIAAVELERERMIILGQVVPGLGVDDLALGQEMELVMGPIGVAGGDPRVVWMWAPVGTEGR
jgi:uncharacterized OB-fold protein